MKSFYVPEPDLIFKDGKTCTDPRIGLLNYQPNGLPNKNFEIPIGIIGSKSSKNRAIDFLNFLKYSIEGKMYPNSNIRSVNFPGLYRDGPLGFYFKIDNNYSQEILDYKIENIIDSSSRKEAIILFANEITQILEDLGAQNPPRPIILLAIPRKILKKCVDPFLKSNKIKLSDRYYRNLKRIAKLPDEEKPLFFDFHNYIKVIGYKLNLTTQIILPETLNFKAGDEEDPATLAWNFCVAQYYKYLGVPWKLADLNPETVHVGISFYYDINLRNSVIIKAAIAQVYMRTGDSQIARGLEIDVKNEEDIRRTNLTEDESFDIIQKAIMLYRRQHENRNPYRLVIHKKSMYTEQEIEGFSKAAAKVETHDYLHIKEYCNFKVLTPTKYPIMRGSVFQRKSNNKNIINLFTTGYIPCFDTYQGSFVPKPIEIIVEEAESGVERIAKDILDLTKLDWNSADFCKRLPATIAVSQKVGNIMGELRGRDIEPPTAYYNYM